jgi:hypothetical protein
MTKKHYIAIAKEISGARSKAEQNGLGLSGQHAIDKVVHNLYCLFKSENPKFDSARFAKACEVKP